MTTSEQKDELPVHDNILCVSGFWSIKSKHSQHNYIDWFRNTLRINQQYTFFYDANTTDNLFGLQQLQQFRPVDTEFVHHPISEFYSARFYNTAIADDRGRIFTHPVHVPTIELGQIWHEKVHLVKLAKDRDEGRRAFYVWIDAGICTFRNSPPPVARLTINNDLLPQNKLSYAFVNDDHHSFAGTVLIFPCGLIDSFHDLYYQKLEQCVQREDADWRCGSDQFVMTELRKDHPDLFHIISYGYGENLLRLYEMSAAGDGVCH